MPLRALQEALARHPARAQRNLGLDDIVAGAERIAFRIKKGGDARTLIIAQMIIGYWGGDGGGACHQREFPPAHARRPKHSSADHPGDQRRAQIGLLQDQTYWHQYHQCRWDQKQWIAHAFPGCAMKPSRQAKRQHDFHEF